MRDTDPSKSDPARPRRRGLRFALWLLGGLVTLGLAAAVAAALLIGRNLSVPAFLQQRIEARIDAGLGPLDISFRDMSFVVRQGWRPRVRLRGAALRGADGQTLVQLANAEASLAMRPLLRGQVIPKRVYLSGASATLRRDAEGRFTLFLGDATLGGGAANLPQLLEEWEQFLTLPQFSALTLFEMEALTLRLEDLRLGRAWTLDGGRIALARNGDEVSASASFSLLGGGDYASLVEASYGSRIGTTEAQFGISVQDIAAEDIAVQAVALNWLAPLRAPISGSLRGAVDGQGALGPVSATLQIGAGVLQPNAEASPVPFDGARSYFTYRPDERVLVFDELSIASAWGRGTADGRAYLGGVAETGRLTDLEGQFTLSGASLNPDDLYEQPLDITRAVTDFRLTLDPFRLTLGQMQISDGQSEMLIAGTLAAAADGWRLAVDGQIDAMTTERLMALWPERAAPKPRKWVAENILGGEMRNLALGLRLAPESPPKVSAGFDFEGAEVRFLKSMPPVRGAAGYASLHEGRFVVTASEGRIPADEGGEIDIAGTAFIIPDVGIRKEAPGVVRFEGEGPATAVLSLLNRPPLQVLKGTPLPVDVAQAQVRANGVAAMALKEKLGFSEITFHVDGNIAEASSAQLVPGHEVTAQSLRVTGDQNGIEISGPVRISGVPAQVTWRQRIGKGVPKESRATGSIELSQRTVDAFGIGLPRGAVFGEGQGDFTLDLAPGQAPALTVTSDLRGLGLRLPELAWSKPEATPGLLQMAGSLGSAARIDRLVVQGPGLAATGSVLTTPEGGLERALFSSVRRGGWLDAQIELRGRGRAAPALRILGGTMDMRRADFGTGGTGGGGGSTSGPIEVTLDRLQVTDTIALTGFAGSFTTHAGLSGDFRGRINGQTDVTGQMIPQTGGSAVRVKSADAGGVFRAAGVLRQGRGGDFSMTLVPAQGEGQYNGTLKVTETRVKDAPAIAALINAVSVIGLIDEMSGQGIQFTEVEAKFRLSPSRITVYSSSAVGPSIGLSMDGLYDVPTGRLNMRGVVSPLYLLNGIGSVVTQRKGEGVFGFNYTLRGTASNPSVSVNPLSALTPSVFRDIFRGPRPQSPEEAAREAEKPQAPRRELGGSR